ncbi:MAG: hypothetical protein FD168_1802 [Desulfobulbaceae bacterium]|nr:MAG: hypothetical protein FD168_1802 [Desulfobulbaceae bacterium]
MAQPPEGIKIFRHIFTVTALLLLPALQFVFIGWLYGLVPLLVFYYFCRFGQLAGSRYILAGSVIAFIVGLIMQTASLVVLAMTLMPAGVMLAHSVLKAEPPYLAGLKGFAVLILSWFLFSGVIAVSEGTHPYSLLQLSINQGMDEALKFYQEDEKIPPDSRYLLVETFTQIKQRLLQFLPAILTGAALFSVWLAMVIGNRLLQQNTGAGPWPEYKHWQLPDKLVWSVIFAAFLALIPVPTIRTIAFNLLLVASVIYCFQGFAIVLFFFEKWKVPVLIRSLLYVIFFFQSLGTIFLSVIGLADVWFDLRHSRSQNATPTEPS